MSDNYYKYSLNSDCLTDAVLNDYMCTLIVLWFVCVSVFEFVCPHACVGMCAQMYGGEGLMSVPPSISTLLYETRSHWNQSSLIWLDCLQSRFHRGIPGVCCHAELSRVCWDHIQSSCLCSPVGPVTLRTTLQRALTTPNYINHFCYCDKHHGQTWLIKVGVNIDFQFQRKHL